MKWDLRLIYITILSQINKQLPSNIASFKEIPDELKYKTKKNINFMIYSKISNLIIFQFPFQKEL